MDSNWLWFAIGFIAFPVAAAVALWLFHRATQVTPTRVSSMIELQEVLRALLAAGHDRETLFVSWLPSGLEVRVTKRSRVSKPSTLDIELRNSGANQAHYQAARDCLTAESIEFDESFTPARRQPKRIRGFWPDGGPFVVSAAAAAISAIASCLPDGQFEGCAASTSDPSQWSDTDFRAA